MAGSGGWELRPVEGSVGWEGLSKMKLVLLSFGSVTGLTKKVDPLCNTVSSPITLNSVLDINLRNA